MIGADTETYPMGPETIRPKVVCVSVSDGRVDKPSNELIREIYGQENVWTFAAFDSSCLIEHFPETTNEILAAYHEGRTKCIIVREKLINFAKGGKVAYTVLPNGAQKKIKYNLSELCQKYLAISLDEEKKGEDSWRLLYSQLDEYPIAEWPKDAVYYALGDACYAHEIYAAQEEAIAKLPYYNKNVEVFRTLLDFCLYQISAQGIRVDAVKKKEIHDRIETYLVTGNIAQTLYGSGILRPPEPPRAYKRGGGQTKGKAESVNRKALVNLVIELGRQGIVKYKLTDKDNVSVNASFLKKYAPLNPILLAYHKRQKYQKIITTELPRTEWPQKSGNTAERVYPCFDCMKETGRTSSYASKIYPSINIQNVKADVREIFIPDDGFVFYSVDYSQLELCTLAQTLFNIFGVSALRDKINGGIDLHADLGSALARDMDNQFGLSSDDTRCYLQFLDLKKTQPDYFVKWRTYAKPVGLGYPGGLGPDTFIEYSYATYELEVTREQAVRFRQIWLRKNPEMEPYFDWIKRNVDQPHTDMMRNAEPDEESEGAPTKKFDSSLRFFYKTPMGMVRQNCTFCKAANGKALQSPAAEGACSAVINAVLEQFDQTSPLALYQRMLAFIHDEMFGQVIKGYEEPVGNRLKEIGIKNMRRVCPDVDIKMELKFMDRWFKKKLEIK